MGKKRLLASAGLAAAVGLGAVWFGVAGAQTPDTTMPPTPKAPAPNSGERAPRPDRGNCPEKGADGSSEGGTSQAARFGVRFVPL